MSFIPLSSVTGHTAGQHVKNKRKAPTIPPNSAVPAAFVPTPKAAAAKQAPVSGFISLREAVAEHNDSAGTSFPQGVATKSKKHRHIAIIARAGTGKTFTLVEGVQRQYGLGTPGIVGSDQQEAIWKELCTLRSPRRVMMVAFNRSVKDELRRRIKLANLTEWVDVKTAHGFGYFLLRKAKLGKQTVMFKTSMLLERKLNTDVKVLFSERPGFVPVINKIVSLAKANLMGVGYGDYPELTPDVMEWIVGHYGLALPEEFSKEIYQLCPELLTESVNESDIIDYDDMVCQPVLHNLGYRDYDQTMVDEAQDLTVATRTLTLRSANRLVIVGDPAQAIYGFAGADCESMDNYLSLLNAGIDGCSTFPLTKTRRCGTSIVALAQDIVPDIEPLENAHEGSIRTVEKSEYLDMCQPGDMVICRTNAPLISGVMKMLRSRRKAWVEGRDTVEDLQNIIKRLKCKTIAELSGKIDDWYMNETDRLLAKKYASEEAQIALGDKYECLMTFMEGAGSVDEVLRNINEVFVDTSTEDGEREGTRFSSIHRAKGLEAPNVFFLHHDKCPHPMAKTEWQKMQEWNLRYVAITRTINNLILVPSESETRDA